MNFTSKRQRKYGRSYVKQQKRNIKHDKILSIRNLLDNKKYDLALENIEEYINEFSLDCYIIHEYGKYFLKIGEHEKAKKYFLINVENNAHNMYYSMYELGRIAKFDCDYALAIDYFVKIINSKHPDKCYSLLELAKIYCTQEKIEEAEDILLEIINKKFPNKKLALIELVQIKIQKNEIEEAEYYLSQIDEKDKFSKIKLLKGQIELKKGNIEKGKKIIQEIVDNDKKFTIIALFELAKIEHKEGNYIKSIEISNKIKEECSFLHVDNVLLLASSYLKLNMFDEVNNEINQLLEFGDLYKNEICYYKGKLLMNNKNYKEALENFDKITTENKIIYKSKILESMYILILQENYLEAYNRLNELKELYAGSDYINLIEVIEIYIYEKLNIENNFKIDCYLKSMVVDYNKEQAIEHIKKHKFENNFKSNHTIFFEYININEIYEFAFNNINESNFIKNDFTSVYLLEYPNVGYKDEVVLNHIKVVVLPNSKDIITIYPVDINDINKDYYEENKNKELPKVKKMSRIEKFNQKYNIS